MRTLARTAVALGFVSAMAIGTTVPVMAQGIYFGGIGHPYHRHYYDYYGGGAWNGCPPDWTIQGGVCKPYRHGPWDIYGGRQSDYGY